MRNILLGSGIFLVALSVIAGCSRAPTRTSLSTTFPAILYTDVTGPSEASGDCGGFAFWLEEKEGRYQAGEVAEFEGGCGVYRKPVTDLRHDPRTGALSFFAPANDPGRLLKFEGRVNATALEGKITQVDERTKKPMRGVSPARARTYLRVDVKEFERRLPQNSGE